MASKIGMERLLELCRDEPNGLYARTRARVRLIEQEFSHLIGCGIIKKENLRVRALDFGTGAGAGAAVIKKYGGSVTGLDNWDVTLSDAVEQGILLPEDAILIGDGFDYLEWLSSTQPQSVDFISVLWMNWKFPYENMCKYASDILKQGGQLLVTCGSGSRQQSGLSESKEELQKRVSHLGILEDIEVVSPVSNERVLLTCAFVYTK